MTLNAFWIERLTLRSQVIRETKGQAKQQEKTPTHSNTPPSPQSKKNSKCSQALPYHHSSLHDFPPYASALCEQHSRTGRSQVGKAWSKWMNLEWKCYWGVCIWLPFSWSNLKDRTCGETDNGPAHTSSAAFWNRLTVPASSILTMFADDSEARRGPKGRLRRRRRVRTVKLSLCALPSQMLHMHKELCTHTNTLKHKLPCLTSPSSKC